MNEKYRNILVCCLFIAMPTMCLAELFSYNASYDICFTPGNDCASEIINEIKQAKKQVLVQAYSFTDTAIANALIDAKKKGVDVRVVLDKSQTKGRYTLIDTLNKNKIKPVIDHRPAIAHNKLIIIDESTVIGGSYNYTKNAAKRNAENVIIVRDAVFAKKYVKNWHEREQKSVVFDEL